MFRCRLLWNGDSLTALGAFSLTPFRFIGNANHRSAELAVEFNWHRTRIISVKKNADRAALRDIIAQQFESAVQRRG
jgi:hypothetical protein